MTPINPKSAQKGYPKNGTSPFTNIWKLPPWAEPKSSPTPQVQHDDLSFFQNAI